MDLSQRIPGLQIDLKYFGNDNFTGNSVAGYESAKALLTEQGAEALAQAQENANSFGLSLLIFDAYRPQRAVDYFREWSLRSDGPDTKAIYFPELERNALFELGYLATHSTHSRASTVDLCLADRTTGHPLDMGTAFDRFDPASHTNNPTVSLQQRANRLLLKTLMESAGFENYWMEWWHFTLRDEPYPETYFDFPVT